MKEEVDYHQGMSVSMGFMERMDGVDGIAPERENRILSASGAKLASEAVTLWPNGRMRGRISLF